MIIQGFDGKVECELTGNNMMAIVVGNGMDRDIPQQAAFTSDDRILYANLKAFLSRTKWLKVLDPNEQDETVLSLATFWDQASKEPDYAKIWKEFLYLDPAVNNGWIEMINKTETARLKSPPSVRPGTPTDEQLEDMGEVGQDFLEPAGTTSPKSKRRP